MAEIRRNRAKHKLAQGGIVSVPMGPTSAEMLEFLGQFDFDALWIEAEHGPVDYSQISDLTRACDLWGKTSIVRVNMAHPGVIYRTLDQGAQGIAVPHVNTAEEARAIVDAAKFGPIGHRGSYVSRQGLGVPDYFQKANDETMIVVLIEDIVAVNNLADILKVDHIDVFFVAPGDLAQSMGYTGQPGHPEVVRTTEKAIDQIASAGRVAGTLVNDATVERWVKRGARFLTMSWTAWTAAGAQAYLSKVNSLAIP